MKRKISVIIPVYNGKKYLARCIDSVLSQRDFDIDDLEILVLNDGSSDSSLNILEKYGKRFPHIIKVINQKNVGVARTRNNGIELAEAKYTMFIDQDDYIDADYCKTFYETAERDESDIVVGGYRRPSDDGNNVRVVKQSNTEYSKKYKISAAWAKIHRTDFLKQNKIRFYDNNYGEDILFTMHENSKTKRVTSTDYIGYNWYWNSDSVSNTSQRGLNSNINILKLLDEMIPCIDNELDEYYVIQTGIHYLLFSGRNAPKVDFLGLYSKIFELFDDKSIAYRKNKLIPLGPKGALAITRVAVSVFIILHNLNLMGSFAKIYCKRPAN